MKIVVVGGTGLIGTRVSAQLAADGHDVTIASRATGVNSYTGEGLTQALTGADTLIDVSNSSYFDAAGANDFFYGSTLNLLTYGAAAGVGHHVALSVVGTDRLARSEGGYFVGKAAQEELIRTSGRPFSIVHATQFFEFLGVIADAGTEADVVRLAQALIQPIAANDVATALRRVANDEPVNTVVEFAGPEQFHLGDLVQHTLRTRNDRRIVEIDPLATYFGTNLEQRELLPGPHATLMPTTLAEWERSGEQSAGLPAVVDGRSR